MTSLYLGSVDALNPTPEQVDIDDMVIFNLKNGQYGTKFAAREDN